MAETSDKDAQSTPEEDVWGAISAFEQILEAMPYDRASLETLSSAYEQIGDHTRAKEYLIRLGRVLLQEGDHATAASLLDKLAVYSEQDQQVAELISEITGTVGSGTGDEKPAPPGAGPKTAAPAPVSGFSIANEMSLAWALMEAGELTQDEYAGIVQNLTEVSGHGADRPLSVLHVLESSAAPNLEQIVSYLAKEYSTPIVLLDNFEFNADAATLLPRDFMVKRCAMVFEFLGSDALVVVLNPSDTELREDVKRLTARSCHFYVTLASQFDRAIERLDEVLEDREQIGET